MRTWCIGGRARDRHGRSRAWVAASFERRGYRAIGVVYHPARELRGNYVPTVLPARYDALLHIDDTRAVQPLHMPAATGKEPPETCPSGV